MLLRAALTAAALAFVATSAEAAPFTNGDFESGPPIVLVPEIQPHSAGETVLTGWEILGGGIDYVGNYWNHASGNHSIDLTGKWNAGGIRQTFDTVSGVEYTVSFFYASNPLLQTQKSFSYEVRGVGGVAQLAANTIVYTQANALNNMGWIPVAFTFIADGAAATITFLGLTGSGYGTALDGVSIARETTVTVVPLPMAFPLFAAGLGALSVIRRRKKSA